MQILAGVFIVHTNNTIIQKQFEANKKLSNPNSK